MPLVHFGKAPYAPASSIIAVIEKHRHVRLTKIDEAILDARIGITEALRPRTLAALEMLDLIDSDGVPTPVFAQIPNLSDAEFKPALGEMLRKAYAPIIEDLKADELGKADKVEAAFRSFTPTGQIKRMVNLYLGLMTYAELITEGPRTRGKSTSVASGVPSAPRIRTVTPTRTQTKAPEEKPFVPPQDPPPQSAYSRSVDLAGGAGVITLSGSVNPFALKGASRDFVFAMIDLMDDYDVLNDEAGVSTP